MLALCLMLSVTYYAQNYAGIIGWSLIMLLLHSSLQFDASKCYTIGV